MGSSDERRAPTELSRWLACHRASALDAALDRKLIAPPSGHDPTRDLLAERGILHEAKYIEHLRTSGLEVEDLRGKSVDAVLDAMARGVAALEQATLVDAHWSGAADVLVRVDGPPSHWGPWSYEVHDTKLARQTKVGTIVQLAVYSEILGALQGVTPARFWVVAPRDPFVPEPHRVSDYAAYVRAARRRFEQDSAIDARARLVTHEPEPCEHCSVCRWWKDCGDARRQVDHLSLVAGIGLSQRVELRRQGVMTTAALAETPTLPEAPQRGHAESYVRLHRQAAVLVRERETSTPEIEMLAIGDAFGLASLPAPSTGDLFLDLEADPFVEPAGREYLFGRSWFEGDADRYAAIWATDEAAEKRAFETTMDVIMERQATDPGMHVYHFGAYERGALARMVGRHATRAAELDRLLRAGVLVDLHQVVKRTLLASVERYSLKELERFFGFRRALPLEQARRAMRGVERALELGYAEAIGDDVRAELESYNRDDCVSTRWLRDWLERLRDDVMRERGIEIPRPALRDGEASEDIAQRESDVARMQALLRAGIPDEGPRTEDERGRWLLAHLLEFHRREEKATAWEKFRLQELDAAERLRERDAIAELEPLGAPESVKQSWLLRYRFAPQETSLTKDKPLLDAAAKSFGRVASIDRVRRELTVKIAKTSWDRTHRDWLFTSQSFGAEPKPTALLAFAGDLVNGRREGWDAACALLFRETPRLRDGVPWRVDGEGGQAQALRVIAALDRSVLAIQGPPGTGKTTTAAKMVEQLVRAGRSVGVSALSHAVIRNFLLKVDTVTEGRVRVGAKVEAPQDGCVRETTDNDEARGWIDARDVHVVGGTPWLWAHERFRGAVDVLFVDEAGQLALADVLALARGAKSLVLLGDPQQLEQPRKAKHPDGTDVSALAHVIGDRATIEAERGIFLEETWRLPPPIRALTSELFYDGRLQGRAGLESRALLGAGPWDGAGVWFVPVEHEGRSVEAPEEVERVVAIVTRLMSGVTWRDMVGLEKTVGAEQILVVAPYNAQVAALGAALAGTGVRVGTVDKFQGREAEVVIYSMTSSTIADAPKGIGFLFDAHRWNVATSRARVSCVIVGSPRLVEHECRTPRDARLANVFARFLEGAG